MRLVLLTRGAGQNWLQRFRFESDGADIEWALGLIREAIVLKGLKFKNQSCMNGFYESIIRHYAQYLNLSGIEYTFSSEQLAKSEFQNPQLMIMSALLTLQESKFTDLTKTQLLDALWGKEIRFFSRYQLFRENTLPLELSLILVVLSGGFKEQGMLEDLLTNVPSLRGDINDINRKNIAKILHQCYCDLDYHIAALHPDILGEHAVTAVLGAISKGDRQNIWSTLLNECNGINAEIPLLILCRISESNPEMKCLLFEALDGRFENLLNPILAVLEQTNNESLFDFVNSSYCTLSDLSRSEFLYKIAKIYRRNGHAQLALSACVEAVNIDEFIVRQDRAYMNILANHLNDLSICYKSLLMLPLALKAIKKAVRIHRILSKNDSTKLQNLAVSLENLSVCYYEMGKFQKAFRNSSESVQIHEQSSIPNDFFQKYQLSAALTDLSLHASACGDLQLALDSCEKAVKIKEILAEENKAYLGELALSLHNLSKAQFEAQLREEALISIDRAIQIRREIAEVNPLRGYPDLAYSLGNAGTYLFSMGDAEASSVYMDETLNIIRGLSFENNPTMLEPYAYTLLMKAQLEKRKGRHYDAYQAIEESLETLIQLNEHNSEKFDVNLQIVQTLHEQYYLDWLMNPKTVEKEREPLIECQDYHRMERS